MLTAMRRNPNFMGRSPKRYSLVAADAQEQDIESKVSPGNSEVPEALEGPQALQRDPWTPLNGSNLTFREAGNQDNADMRGAMPKPQKQHNQPKPPKPPNQPKPQ